MTAPPPSDAILVRAFTSGNKRLQAICYRKCRATFDKISRYFKASEQDLDDLFHESFEALWSSIDSGAIFVEGSGVKALRSDGITNPINDLTGAYFAGIVRFKFLEYCRRHDRIAVFDDKALPEAVDLPPDETIDDDIDTIKDRLTLISLNSLAKSCIEILTKFYHESKSLQEILAERPENNSYDGLKSQKAKCLKTLKEKIIILFKAHGLTPP